MLDHTHQSLASSTAQEEQSGNGTDITEPGNGNQTGLDNSSVQKESVNERACPDVERCPQGLKEESTKHHEAALELERHEEAWQGCGSEEACGSKQAWSEHGSEDGVGAGVVDDGHLKLVTELEEERQRRQVSGLTLIHIINGNQTLLVLVINSD